MVRATNAPNPANTIIRAILLAPPVCVRSIMSSASLREDADRSSTTRIGDKPPFLSNMPSPRRKAALPLVSPSFDTEFPVPVEDDFWVRLPRIPEPFRVDSLKETERCLESPTANQPARKRSRRGSFDQQE